MLENLIKATQDKFNKALDSLKMELSGVRTGRASPTLIENVKVPAYGSEMRLIDLASIAAPEARLLVVQPFDPSNASAIEKAIREAGLGLNPGSSEGNIIRVPMPSLTEETRKNYLKIVHDKAETSRVAVRNIRHMAMDEVDKVEKQKMISEDEKFRFKEQIQKEVEKVTVDLEELVKAKEQDLLEI